MTVVVDFDPLGHLVEFEELRQVAEDLGLGPAFRQPPFERFNGIAGRLLHQLTPVAALRDRDRDRMARLFGQSFGDQFLLRQLPVDEDGARRRHLLVELQEHVGHHLGLFDIAGVLGKDRAVPPILAAPDEERLDTHLPAL